jgi:hypothetical protein
MYYFRGGTVYNTGTNKYTENIFMFKLGQSSLIILFAISLFSSCIEPYSPKLNGYESLLVIDGLITDENSACTVRLSRTFQEQNSSPVMVSDATLSLRDDIGNISYLKNSGDGVYKTDINEFKGIVGRTYVLHILTKENEEYESDPCLMQSVPFIDSIYIAKDQILVNNQAESEDGVSIYLDSKGADNNLFYRWTYEETWKFRVPNPKLYDYKKVPDKPYGPLIKPVSDIKEYCWKNIKSDEILIRSINEGQSKKIGKQPINFIATEKSDRLLIEYSILVKQYSISKKEYDFWNNLKEVNEAGGDIFARQPFAVISNIHSTKDPNERVLGFFQVSAVSQKRKNIAYRDVALMGLHFYSYPCRTWIYNPASFETLCACPPKTWDDVYWYLCVASDYYFTRPIYEGLGDSKLLYLEFTRPECADCELAGSHTEPVFWSEFK